MTNNTIKIDILKSLEQSLNFLHDAKLEDYVCYEFDDLEPAKEEIKALINYWKNLDKNVITAFYQSAFLKVIEKLKVFKGIENIVRLGFEYEFELFDLYFYAQDDKEDIIFSSNLEMHPSVSHLRELTFSSEVMSELYDGLDEDYGSEIENLIYQFNNLCLHEMFMNLDVLEGLKVIFGQKSITAIAERHDHDDTTTVAIIA